MSVLYFQLLKFVQDGFMTSANLWLYKKGKLGKTISALLNWHHTNPSHIMAYVMHIDAFSAHRCGKIIKQIIFWINIKVRILYVEQERLWLWWRYFWGKWPSSILTSWSLQRNHNIIQWFANCFTWLYMPALNSQQNDLLKIRKITIFLRCL
jgi:hypothetical protein